MSTSSMVYRLMSDPEIGPRLLFADDPEAELQKILDERMSPPRAETGHVRAKTYRARRTSRNAAVAHKLDEPPRTMCGAPITDRDVRLSDCVRAGKLTKYFRRDDYGMCANCRRAIEEEVSP